MTTADSWRALAKTFPLIRLFVDRDDLSEAFGPTELMELYEDGPINVCERSVLRFLLHVWDRYDYCFELSALSVWGVDDREAFSGWASGTVLGEPCRYF